MLFNSKSLTKPSSTIDSKILLYFEIEEHIRFLNTEFLEQTNNSQLIK